jgi:hypothetical protein
LCVDGTFTEYSFLGTCVEGECTYDAEATQCDAGCGDGECAAVADPCDGVACDAPDAFCDGDFAVSVDVAGTCVDGTCEFVEEREDCGASGDICDGGRCVDPCRGVRCDDPPATLCDADERVSFGEGQCMAGECEYPEEREDCTGALGDGFCEAGECEVPDRCEGVVCDPPPPYCDDGGRLVTSTSSCDANTGECAVREGLEFCRPDEFCVADACVADPCFEVLCDSPPSASCDGYDALAYLAVGVCEEGVCAYALDEARDCSADGLWCADGTCVDVDPCDTITCDEPPPAFCDGDTSMLGTGGRCAGNGECRYDSVPVNCALGGQVCFEGECVDPTPCADVCTDPPAVSCEGDLRVESGEALSCDGACEYERIETDCRETGDYCVEGTCVEGDPCESVTCDEALPNECSGNFVLRFDPTGVCGPGGICDYRSVRLDCAAGGGECVEGACVFPDPCDILACDTPPANRCDGLSLVRYPAGGTCADRECGYEEETIDCADEVPDGFCSAGACVSADPCFDVPCDTPPVPVCDGLRVLTFVETGTCLRGDCNYGVGGEEDCSAVEGGICADGACSSTDPCFDVACDAAPTSVCRGNSRVDFAPPGACVGGLCEWEESSTDCGTSFCSGGVCGGAGPCAGVECFDPPANRCDGDTLVWSSTNGSCDLGFCDYEENRVDCAASGTFCNAGACSPLDPCDGLSCDVAPLPDCRGDSVVAYEAPGVCSGGDCFFTNTVENCSEAGGTCVDGSCASIDLCDGVSCDVPAVSMCDRNTAVSFAAPGVCAEGVCEWVETRVDCLADGRFCSDGNCQELDPCDTVACNEPPPSVCEGSVALDFGFPGTCAAGTCDYEERRTDCALSGDVCQDGLCVADTVCLGVICDAPERSSCEDRLAIQVLSPGECAAGSCSYDVDVVDCAATGEWCSDGLCVATDPCIGLDCSLLLAPSCDGNMALTYPGGGSCVAGVCEENPSPVDCGEAGQFCVDGACVDDDPCDGVSCDAPSPYCEGLSAVTVPAAGTCELGSCSYLRTTVDCGALGQICEAGTCVPGDVCAELNCTIPPNSTCDGDTRVAFTDPASCSDDACVWTETRTDCLALDRFCSDGTCVGFDPCDGVSCDVAPDAECRDGVAVTWSGGSCAAGACSFDASETDCTATGQFCEDGACVAADPCVGVVCTTPPEASCAGDDVVTGVSPGTCVDGVCDYAQALTLCSEVDEVCFEGACGPDLCEGVSCPGTPAPSCDGDVAVVPLADPCEGGACTYPTTRVNCRSFGFQCVLGACLPADPCDLLRCDTPPDSRCLDIDELVEHAASGTCSEGVCAYSQTSRFCSDSDQVCISNACVPDPCDTVTCDDPPPSYCAGSVVISSLSSGACELGGCFYETEVGVDCADTGEVCDAGACVVPDECTGVLCVSAPAGTCVGRQRLTYFPFGSCDDGYCTYDESLFDCEPAGQWCEDGSCVLEDPCLGVDCSGAASVPYCERDVRYVPTGAPACSAGLCEFPTRTTEDCAATGEFCVDGECVATDPCIGLACNTPPSPLCDTIDVVTYDPDGFCVGGLCSYRSLRERCPPGSMCAGATCDDPCLTQECPAPPPFCEGNVSVSGLALGVCDPTDGSCSYPLANRTDCGDDLVCNAGTCRAPEDVIEPGDLVFSEIMLTAAGSAGGQWIELRNLSGHDIALEGVAISDLSQPTVDPFVFPAATLAEADDFVVIVSALGAAAGSSDANWGGPGVWTLAGEGSLAIFAGDTLIGSFAYDAPFGATAGIAMQVDAASYADSSDTANWCAATSDYDGGRLGTPRAANFSCE